MNDKSQTLAQRREMLVQRCRLQRQQLAAQRLAMRQSFGIGQAVSKAAQFGRDNPLLIAGVALGFFVLRPRRFLSLAMSATTLWKTWQRFSPLVSPLVSPLLAKHLRK